MDLRRAGSGQLAEVAASWRLPEACRGRGGGRWRPPDSRRDGGATQCGTRHRRSCDAYDAVMVLHA